MPIRTLLLIVTLLAGSPALAQTFRLGLLHGDEEIFDYEISVLRLALEHAPGDHRLEIVPLPDATQERIFAMLDAPSAPVNLFFSGFSPSRESRLLQVNVPLTRGLLGYRLFAVKSSRLPELVQIHSLADLKDYRIGSGIGWPDNDVLSANGLSLVTSRYENLWRMLEVERFDLFHRGIQEIFTELGRPGREDLAVLPNVALFFPFDYFFYVSRQRPDLHNLLFSGLVAAYDSGAFMANFERHPAIRNALDRGELASRTLLRLELPENYRSLNRIPTRFWHEPQRQIGIVIGSNIYSEAPRDWGQGR